MKYITADFQALRFIDTQRGQINCFWNDFFGFGCQKQLSNGSWTKRKVFTLHSVSRFWESFCGGLKLLFSGRVI
ncbi:MAG: hypothetical protein ACFFAU_00955 [Candidatus Hodarchaeota archaeon]